MITPTGVKDTRAITIINLFAGLVAGLFLLSSCYTKFTVPDPLYSPSVNQYYEDRFVDYGETYVYRHPEAPYGTPSPYIPQEDNDAQYRNPSTEMGGNYYPLYEFQKKGFVKETGDGVYEPFATDNTLPYEYGNGQLPYDHDADYYPLYYYNY